MTEKEPHEPPKEPVESPKPLRHLPEIGEKPVRWRRNKALKIGMGASAVAVVVATSFRLLQHYEPGPHYTYVAPPAPPSLASLAIAKGFPEKCLEVDPDPFGIDPTTDPSNTDPNVEDQTCFYSGHLDGQPAPIVSCEVTLERNTWSDPYHFSVAVAGAGGKPVYMGKDAQFSDIPATQGVPAACAQENITFP